MKLPILRNNKKIVRKNNSVDRLEELGVDREQLADTLAHGCDPYNENQSDEISIPTKDGSRVTLRRGKSLTLRRKSK